MITYGNLRIFLGYFQEKHSSVFNPQAILFRLTEAIDLDNAVFILILDNKVSNSQMEDINL